MSCINEKVHRNGQLANQENWECSKQEAAITAMLSERTYTAAAAKTAVGKATPYRWIKPMRDIERMGNGRQGTPSNRRSA